MTIDPRTIEGSPERAADRGREQGFEYFAQDGQQLASAEVVEGLVRQFIGECIDARLAIHEERFTPEQGTNAMQDASKRYAAIFMGKDKAYAASPWNTPEALGAHIAANYEGAGDKDAACEALFLRLAADTMKIAKAHEEDELEDDAAQFQLDALVEDAVITLLGLPAEAEDPEGE
jgi:hypothetical protein